MSLFASGRSGKMLKLFSFCALILAVAAGAAGCRDAGTALVGRWVPAVGSWVPEQGGRAPSGFPGDLEFLKDGTGIVDKRGVKWTAEDGRLILRADDGQAAGYGYQFSGSTLILADDQGRSINYLTFEAKAARKAALEAADAQYNLGNMYSAGRGVPEDKRKAGEWYQKAAEGFQRAAEQGDAYAQLSLGDMYKYGVGVPKDERKAEECYKKTAEGYQIAAEQGDVNAQNFLGNLYRNGLGVPKDERKAEELRKKAAEGFQRAAEQGDAEAQNWLGIMYLKKSDSIPGGSSENLADIRKANEKAAEWLQKAAEQGYAEAQYRLGSSLAYLRPLDYYRLPPDKQEQVDSEYKRKAEEWLQKALEGFQKTAQGDARR